MKKQNETEKDVRAFAEKLGQFDLQELRELSANALTMRDEALKKSGEGHRLSRLSNTSLLTIVFIEGRLGFIYILYIYIYMLAPPPKPTFWITPIRVN